MVTVNKDNFNDLKTAEIETGKHSSFCITEKERQKLKEKFEQMGGAEALPWYKWILQNVTVSVDSK